MEVIHADHEYWNENTTNSPAAEQDCCVEKAAMDILVKL